jgi:hypothetical protein
LGLSRDTWRIKHESINRPQALEFEDSGSSKVEEIDFETLQTRLDNLAALVDAAESAANTAGSVTGFAEGKEGQNLVCDSLQCLHHEQANGCFRRSLQRHLLNNLWRFARREAKS